MISAALLLAALPYVVVGTGQTKCYDNRDEIAPPKLGQAFYGQDAQHPGPAPCYRDNKDGTVTDLVTGLMWQRSPDTTGDGKLNYADKLTFAQAKAQPAKLNAAKFAGYSDWRLPTIKELYSLIQFSGVDTRPDGGPGVPFIDTRYFRFAYGDASAGERTIDSQWATSTLSPVNPNQMFGVNFADGRIKGYGTSMPGRGEKKFLVICVRGNPRYGQNDFHDNDDGTVTDRATGLTWEKNDSGKGMNWEQALAYAAKLGGGWRLPNAKELQSIVDYTRSPAINPVFQATKLPDGEYPFYWTSTTHVSTMGGSQAVYVAFGRALGFLRGAWRDVHGAGAQRSDPKTGDPAEFPEGRGPQGDSVRINNYVRCVK